MKLGGRWGRGGAPREDVGEDEGDEALLGHQRCGELHIPLILMERLS